MTAHRKISHDTYDESSVSLADFSLGRLRALGRPFKWSRKKQRAAFLLAVGEVSGKDICRALDINYATLIEWKRYEEFRSRVTDLQEEFMQQLIMHGVASKQRRIQVLNQRWEKMLQVIEERAQDPAMQSVPGGKTGLMTVQIRMIGNGKHAEVIEEYQVDTGLLKELREHEKQAAKELGQLVDRTDITSGGEALPQPILFTMSMSDDPEQGPALIEGQVRELPAPTRDDEWDDDDEEEDE